MSTEPEVLHVDLSDFDSGDPRRRAALVDGVGRSLQTAFVLVKSPISEDFLDDVYGLLEEFFALPASDKRACTVSGSMGNAGYTPPEKTERAVGAQAMDVKEMLNWGRQLPATHVLRRKYAHRYPPMHMPNGLVPGIGPVLESFYTQMEGIQRKLLRVIALVLGCREDFFEACLVDAPHVARAILYPALEPGESPDSGARGHEDINLITVLPRATQPGLQWLPDGADPDRDDNWVSVEVPPHYAACNKGFLIDRVSNRFFGSGWHRALRGPEPRLSVVQFGHMAPDTVLTPLSQFCTPENPPRYTPITAGDLFDRVMWELGLYEQ